MSEPRKKVVPRVSEHVERFRQAGLDTQKFFDALVALRDDSALSKTQREAITKLIAMESFIWYLEAIRNERIDRAQLRDEAARVAEERNAAIKKREPGDDDPAQRHLGNEPVPVKTAATKAAKPAPPNARKPTSPKAAKPPKKA
ncbi:MAG: hypothetical protein HYV07_15375 [Deltaproteobacteria bacterium]|nr:hypothetical protein [Deltaproteobacteria bacterium]